MGFFDSFKSKPTLSELQEEDDRLTTELSVARKKALKAELEARGKNIKDFSSNGKSSGISWRGVLNWLKTH